MLTSQDWLKVQHQKKSLSPVFKQRTIFVYINVTKSLFTRLASLVSLICHNTLHPNVSFVVSFPHTSSLLSSYFHTLRVLNQFMLNEC